MKGKIHSFESFGALDGPGIRFVVFLGGCLLRCKYCHNPDTWTTDGCKEYSPEEVVQEALKYRAYYGNDGGVTVSGGEPLLQIDFVIELFKELKRNSISTVCDTSGATFDYTNDFERAKYAELLKYTDLFLLDIKHIDEQKHLELTGKSNKNTLAFAQYLSSNNQPMWIRHVLVPNITTDVNDLTNLANFIKTLKSVEKVEILPYHTMGISKYEKLGIPYALKDTPAALEEDVNKAYKIINK